MNEFRVIYHEPICPECGSFDIEPTEVETGDGLTETAHICTRPAARPGRWPASPNGAPAMTGQLGVIYMLCFSQPYRHARHYVGWTEDLLDRLDLHASGHGARLIAVISASRDRLHPRPHLRRHPPPRTRHQERRRRGPLLPGLHPPSPQRPVGHLPADLTPRTYPNPAGRR